MIKYQDILTELCRRPELYITEVLIGELRVKQHLNRNAVFDFDRQQSLPDKRCALFNWLKKANDDIIDEIVEIFENNNWHNGVSFIVQQKSEIDNTDIGRKRSMTECSSQNNAKRTRNEINDYNEGGCSNWENFNRSTETQNAIIKELKEHYKEDLEIIRSYWSKFAELNDIMNMDTFYCYKIEIEAKGKKVENKITSFDDLFRISDKRLFVEADAGYGKSTFVHQMAREWVEGKEEWTKKFKFLFLFRLGELTDEDTMSFQSLFQKICLCCNNVVELLTDINVLKSSLFIFDGLDEKQHNFSKEIETILNGMGPKLYNVVISSRIEEKLKKLKENSGVCTTVTLKGFTSIGVEEQMQKFSVPLPKCPSKGTVDLFRVPLYLTFYCLTYSSSNITCISLCALVEKFVSYACLRYRRMVGNEKFSNEDEMQVLLALGKEAQNKFQFVEYHQSDPITDDLLQLAKNIGLIHRNSKVNNINFLHQTIAEYCGSYCWRKDIEKAEIVISWTNDNYVDLSEPVEGKFLISGSFARMLSHISRSFKLTLWEKFNNHVPLFDNYESLPNKILTSMLNKSSIMNEAVFCLTFEDDHCDDDKKLVLDSVSLPTDLTEIHSLRVERGYFDSTHLFENDFVEDIQLVDCNTVCSIEDFFKVVNGKVLVLEHCTFESLHASINFQFRLKSLTISYDQQQNATDFLAFVMQRCSELKNLSISLSPSRYRRSTSSSSLEWLNDLRKNEKLLHALEDFTLAYPDLPSACFQVLTEMQSVAKLKLDYIAI